MSLCSKCGKEISEDLSSCPYCGEIYVLKSSEENNDEIEKLHTDEQSQDGQQENLPETKNENSVNNYIAIKCFIVLSCILNAILTPITLIWCVPMGIYIFSKVMSKKKIGGVAKFFSYVLISPIVGILLGFYKEQN